MGQVYGRGPACPWGWWAARCGGDLRPAEAGRWTLHGGFRRQPAFAERARVGEAAGEHSEALRAPPTRFPSMISVPVGSTRVRTAGPGERITATPVDRGGRGPGRGLSPHSKIQVSFVPGVVDPPVRMPILFCTNPDRRAALACPGPLSNGSNETVSMGSDSPQGSRSHRDGADGRVPVDADGGRLPDGEWVASQKEGANAMGAGLQFGAVICLFAFAGLKLDGVLDTKPLMLVVGVLIGFTGGTISLLKTFK